LYCAFTSGALLLFLHWSPDRWPTVLLPGAWVFTDRTSDTAELDTVADQSAKGAPVTTLSLCDLRAPLVPDQHHAVADDQPATNRFAQATDLRPIVTTLPPGDKASRNNIEALVSAAVDGDREAIDGVLRWIRPLVLRYCRVRVGGQDKTSVSADDVAQEVCLAVLTALPSYRDQGRPFLAFVYGIAAHKVADARRSAARNRIEPVPEIPENVEFADGPEAQVMRSESAERMAKLLSTLPHKQRDILVLRVVVGLSAEMTAAAIGSTPGAVRVAQHRALNRLRTVLKSTARSDYRSRARLHATAVTDKVPANLESFTEWMSEEFRHGQITAVRRAKSPCSRFT